MAKNLVIVESPSKAKTIEKILGPDFKVKSSYGHVRDLDKGTGGVDIENKFKPKYIVSPEKTKVIKELKEAMRNSEEVWLATDEDREGEAISWHLCKVLKLDEKTTKRIVFREITKPAILKAIEEPGVVDLNLVDAQQARRILDRLVGFELSGVLWKKVRGKLSAGRVQSVAVKLIVEREKQIQDFASKHYYKVNAQFEVKDAANKIVLMKATLSDSFDKEDDAFEFLKKCQESTYKISDISVRPGTRKPAAPFTTSTLQQDASRKFGFSVKRTMSTAQKLYEKGLITYMRTDSVTLSKEALGKIADQVQNNYGPEYVNTKQYKTKKSNAQEAHEAIRPTYFENSTMTGDVDQEKLYELIWKRTIASQMSDAKLEKTKVSIAISKDSSNHFVAEGEVLKFDGFLKVYLESNDDDDDKDDKTILPPLTLNQDLDYNNIEVRQRFSNPPARFTEAGLVKKMEENGIGRPSTYAPTITKIMEPSRGYVIKANIDGKPRDYHRMVLSKGKIDRSNEIEMAGAIKNRLMPTDLGILVTDFLEKQFSNIMDYNFTENIENKFDNIAAGNEEWTNMLSSFYDPFHANVEDTIENADRATGERILGKDPESGKTLLVRMSRFGPVVQIGSPDELAEDEKPRYANIGAEQSLMDITAEEAMDLFKLPKEMGDFEEKPVIIGAGRFGPYVKYEDGFISLPKGSDPLSFSMEECIELILIKRKQDEPIFMYDELPVTKGVGRFGPFFKWNGMFVNIPRRFDPDTITEEESRELIKIKIDKEANRYIHNWPEEKISVQNGRWGPFIKFKKANVKLPKNDKTGEKMTPEEAAKLTLKDVKKIIEAG